MKFKVGDKIRGISDNYLYTDKDMTLGEVMSVEPFGIKIKILEHTNESQIGKIHWAITLEEHLERFELVEEKEMSKLETLEKKYKELGEEIERLKNGQAHKPKYAEKYLFISPSGGLMSSVWHGNAVDVRRYAIGNVFKTQEEAEFRAEQLKVEAELRRFARPFVVGEHNYTLNFDHRTNCICTFSPSYTQEGNIHFDSEKIALEAIDTVGAERIKKYYFGVED